MPQRTEPAVRDLFDLSGHVALVTGAGGNIGGGIARRVAEAGAAVVLHCRQGEAGAQQAAADITADGGRALVVCGDLTRPADVEAALDAAAAALGVPDIVINNAGIYPLASILEMSEDEWDLVVDANLKTVHLVTQAAGRRLVAARRPGAIVNVASIEAANVAPMHSHYASAKAGVVMYTRAAARELGSHGIRVNVVSPGLIWREGLDEAWPDGVQRYTAGAPLGRLGRAGDVADACLFLVSEAARWVTGAELVVDGGVLTNRAY
jgi:NAD(P)-dependent dehydrogenase (short-subunit alcohol dehydrogenase family)